MAPEVMVVDLYANNGRRIGKVTKVRFDDGQSVTFLERVPKRRAVEQAEKYRAQGLTDQR